MRAFDAEESEVALGLERHLQLGELISRCGEATNRGFAVGAKRKSTLFRKRILNRIPKEAAATCQDQSRSWDAEGKAVAARKAGSSLLATI